MQRTGDDTGIWVIGIVGKLSALVALNGVGLARAGLAVGKYL